MAQTLRIAAVGDLMLGDQPTCFGFGVRSRYSTSHYEGLVADPAVRDAIREADVAIGNLECAYNNDTPMAFDTHWHCTDEGALEYLAGLGFDALVVANNHVLERGAKGLEDLKGAMTRHHIEPIGLGDPLRIERHGKTVAFVAYTAVPDPKNPDVLGVWHDAALDLVRDLAAETEAVVVCMHWGNELVECPSTRQVELGRALVDAGARLVLGAHPHVLHPVERYKDALIAYSLGNFVFDSFVPDTLRSAVFSFELDLGAGDINYEALPVVTSPRDFHVERADPATADAILKRLQAPIDPLPEDEYRARVWRQRRVYRKAVLRHFAHNILHYKNRCAMTRWAVRRAALIFRHGKRERENPDEVYRWR
mgnify:CR=1 FL=1